MTTAATMLDEVVARAAEFAGPGAWAHTTSIRNLSSILLVNTDWSSPADVDEDAANLICGGLYTWIQESGRSWPGPEIRTASLYGPESEGGVQVFDC